MIREPRTLTYEEWRAEAKSRFPTKAEVAFECPSCGSVMTVADYEAAGAPESAMGFSCVGRWLPKSVEMCVRGKGPCNYSGGGLFGLNPLKVVFPEGREERFFEFAEVVSVAATEGGQG